MHGGAAIFVKTPGLSPVKTRLAAEIGAAAAEAWYRRAATAVAAVLQRVPGLTIYWALAEPLADAAPAWPGLPQLEQGEGELGERMGRVHAALLERHDYALLAGADTPQLDPAQLGLAAAWLSGHEPRLVMGPALDGGFWLLGANRHPQPEDWLRSPCGTADTAQGFQAAMARHGDWRLLQPLTDVDQARDLEAMLREFSWLADPLPEQRALAEWTRALPEQGMPVE